MNVTLDEAYRRYFPLIREKCARMLSDRDEAQDVAQETFIRLWRSAPTDDDVRTVTAWIYRTSTRIAVDRLRRRRFEGEPPELEPHADDQTDEILDARRELARIARNVPAQELEVAVLHRIDGLGQEEIAEVTAVSDRTVRRMLKRFDERIARLRHEVSP